MQAQPTSIDGFTGGDMRASQVERGHGRTHGQRISGKENKQDTFGYIFSVTSSLQTCGKEMSTLQIGLLKLFHLQLCLP